MPDKTGYISEEIQALSDKDAAKCFEKIIKKKGGSVNWDEKHSIQIISDSVTDKKDVTKTTSTLPGADETNPFSLISASFLEFCSHNPGFKRYEGLIIIALSVWFVIKEGDRPSWEEIEMLIQEGWEKFVEKARKDPAVGILQRFYKQRPDLSSNLPVIGQRILKDPELMKKLKRDPDYLKKHPEEIPSPENITSNSSAG